MKFRKRTKLISLLLSVALILGSITIASAEEQPQQMPHNLYKLVALGIVDITDAEKPADSSVNRAELALMAVRLHGSENIVNANYSTRYFYDVSTDYMEAAYINTAARFGLMQEVNEGYFMPRQAVTGKEVIETVVKVLGYESYVKARGGSYEQYYDMAVKLKLLRGVTVSSDAISRADIYRLFLNSLDADLMIADGINNGDVVLNSYKGKTILTEKHDIHVATGVVTSTAHGSITGTAVMKGDKIMVDDKTFECEMNTLDYLGYHVDLYYKTDGSVNNTLYIEKTENETLVLTKDDIVSCDNLVYTYMKNGKRKTEINANGMNVLYNGNKISGSTTDFIPDVGEVAFIDNDDNGEYDVVSIVSYKNKMIISVDISKKTIYTKLGEPISMKEKDVYIYNEYGEKIQLADLRANSGIAVAYDSTGDVKEIITCGRKMTGAISAINHTGNTKYVINGIEYTVASELAEAMENDLAQPFEIGRKGEFLCGMGNQIIWWEQPLVHIGGGDWEFGLLKAATVQGLAQKVLVSVFSSINAFETFEISENVVIDGAYYSKPEDIFNQFCCNGEGSSTDGVVKPQLIRFKTDKNGEKIRYIDKVGTESSPDNGLYFSEYFGTSAGGAHFSKAGLQFYDDIPVTQEVAGKKVQGGMGIIDNKTVAIQCPMLTADMENGLNELDLSEEKMIAHENAYSHFESRGDSRTHNVYAYKVGDNSFTNSVILYGKAKSIAVADRVSSYASVNIFLRSMYTLDSDGNARETIYYYSDDSGEKLAYLSDDISCKDIELDFQSDGVVDGTYTLKKGDLFQFTKNAAGEVYLIRPLYDAENHKAVWSTKNFIKNASNREEIIYSVPTNDYIMMEDSVYLDWGYVEAKKDGIIKGVYQYGDLGTGTDKYFTNYLTRKNQKFYVYDMETEKVSLGKFDEISDYLSSGGKCDRIFVHTRYWTPQKIIVYKE